MLNCKVCFSTLNNQTYIPSAIPKHCMIKNNQDNKLEWRTGSIFIVSP